MNYYEKRAYLESYEQTEMRCKTIKKKLAECESVKVREILTAELEELETKIQNINRAIKNIPKESVRNVIVWKYIGAGERGRLKYDWQIANIMHYSTAWVRKTRRKAIERMEFEG